MRIRFPLSCAVAVSMLAGGCGMPFMGNGGKQKETGSLYETVAYDPSSELEKRAPHHGNKKDGNATTPSGKRVPNRSGDLASAGSKPKGKGGKGKDAGESSGEEYEMARREEAEHQFREALEAVGMRDHSVAEAFLLQATKLDGENPKYWANLGRVRFFMGQRRYASSLDAFRTALRLLREAPPSTDRAQLRQREIGEATVHANMGDVYREWKRPAEALAAYGEAQRLDPRMERLPVEIGHLRLKIGEYDEAESQFKLALRRTNNDPENQLTLKCHLGLAILYHLTERNDQAFKHVDFIERQHQRIDPGLRQAIMESLRREQYALETGKVW